MKKAFLYAATALIGAGLTACSDDPTGGINKSEGVYGTANGQQSGVNLDSRTTVNENELHNLVRAWDGSEKVAIFDRNNRENLGVLTYNGGSFAGKLFYDIDEGQLPVSVVYFGTKMAPASVTRATESTFGINLTEQAGSLESLVEYDVQIDKTTNLNVTKQGWGLNFNLSSTLSFVHFFLNLPETVSVTADNVAVTVSDLNTNGTLDLISGTFTDITSSPITTTATYSAAKGGLDLYIALIPGRNQTAKFAFTIDGTEYTAEDVAWTYEQGIYYRNSSGAGSQITVPDPDPAPAIDHSKNPLLKWAEGDLVYNKSTKTSSVASSYTTQGSLYQWGKNTGFKDYKDALGERSSNVKWGYATYGKGYKTGTGIYNGVDHQSGYMYSSLSSLASNTGQSVWCMNPLGTDYFVSSFGNGGNTWNERAALCGYTENVCPEGYRLPVEADFLEIKPENPISSSDNLASALIASNEYSNLMEIKSNADCKYAIRWTAETSSNKLYLRIDAIVVPESFSESSLTTINWTNDKNVITRYFGANGFIHSFYHLTTGYVQSLYFEFPVGRPMPGLETHTDRLWSSGNAFTVMWDNIKDYSVNNQGFYWMSDAKKAFYFEDNTRTKNVRAADNSIAFPGRKSMLGFLNINPQDACAIRCIKIEE